jgi:hypothetical protein
MGHNERHTKNLELLRDMLKTIPGTKGVSETELTAMRNGILVQVWGAIKPFIQLVSKMSTSLVDLGGSIIKRMADLERGVVHLKATKIDIGAITLASAGPPTPAAATPLARPTLAWALPSQTVSLPAMASVGTRDGNVTALSQRIILLK